MRQSGTVHPTAQRPVADFAPETLFKGDEQIVDRIKRGFLKELMKGFNVLNMMTMPFLIFFFGKGSTFFLIDTRPLVKRTALYIEDFANFCFLDALFQVCCDGSFSHGLRIWHGCSRENC